MGERRAIKFFAIGILISFLLPVIKIGGIGFKPDLIFMFFSLPFLMAYRRRFQVTKNLYLVMVMILLSMTVSNNLGSFYYSSNYNFAFPTDFYQVFSRINGFVLFFYIGYFGTIEYKSFIRILSVTFIVGLLFGVLQFLNIPFIKSISMSLYALTETQMRGFQSLNFRGFGTAGNIITWGGLCGFIFYFFYFLQSRSYLKIIGCLLAVFNVIITASRSALLALCLSFIVIYFYNTIYVKRDLLLFVRNSLYFIIIALGIYFLAEIFIPERLEFLEYRLTKSEEDLTEGGRGAQMQYFFSLLNEDATSYIFGIGKPVLNDLGFMEMEPLFLLVAYGVTGLFLHYLLIFIVFKFSLKVKKVDLKVFLFTLATLVCYLIFSIGFFFFREPYSGMIYWCILGYLLGYSYNKFLVKN